MDKQTLRTESYRLMQTKSLQDSKDSLDIYVHLLFKLINEHTKDDYSKSKSEAKIVLQMVFAKVLNIRGVLDGMNYDNGKGAGLTNFIDPTIIASGVRNVSELASTFHLIYRQSNTEEEHDVLYKLWVVAGLNYRQRFVSALASEENKEKGKEELEDLNKLIDDIHQSQLYQNLPVKKQSLLDNVIRRKDYRIDSSNNDVKLLPWQEILGIMGFKPSLIGQLYTYLSLYAHPSNVSVFQYRELFTPGKDDNIGMSTYNIKNLNAILSLFIADYVSLFPEAKQSFEDTPILNQIIVNWMLRISTTNGQIINDAMDNLN